VVIYTNSVETGQTCILKTSLLPRASNEGSCMQMSEVTIGSHLQAYAHLQLRPLSGPKSATGYNLIWTERQKCI